MAKLQRTDEEFMKVEENVLKTSLGPCSSSFRIVLLQRIENAQLYKLYAHEACTYERSKRADG